MKLAMGFKIAIQINTRKIFNKLSSHKYPETKGGWCKPIKNHIIGGQHAGDLFDPFVIKFDSKYLMFLSSRKKNGIVLYESRDGIGWDYVKDVLISNTENESINRASILMTPKGLWRLYYTRQTMNKSDICLIESTNYLNFKSENTVCCLEHNACVMNPHVLWDSDSLEYKMWFSSGDMYEPDEIYYATSISGINWEVLSNPVLKKEKKEKYRKCKVGGCYVKKQNDRTYEMYYIGYQNIDTSSICHAVSNDGINWTQDDCNPIISPSLKSWDADSVYKPSYLFDNNREMIWYNGRKRKQECIGIAIKIPR